MTNFMWLVRILAGLIWPEIQDHPVSNWGFHPQTMKNNTQESVPICRGMTSQKLLNCGCKCIRWVALWFFVQSTVPSPNLRAGTNHHLRLVLHKGSQHYFKTAPNPNNQWCGGKVVKANSKLLCISFLTLCFSGGNVHHTVSERILEDGCPTQLLPSTRTQLHGIPLRRVSSCERNDPTARTVPLW